MRMIVMVCVGCVDCCWCVVEAVVVEEGCGEIAGVKGNHVAIT